MDKIYIHLREFEQNLISKISLKKKRNLYKNINWKSNCILIYWERWLWKTYMLLQNRKGNKKWFYFSADNHMIENISLFDFVFWIIKNYKENVFYIDEIHKYSNWITELKNLIDNFPDVQFIISWSSAISLYKWTIDLWRRIVDYKIYTLSFSEYLYFKDNIKLKNYSFLDIVEKYNKITAENISKITDISFNKYVKQWYYPFWIDEEFSLFWNRLNKLLDQIILDDMIWIFNFTYLTANKLTKLFYFLANNKPSDISILSLSKKIWVNKDTLSNLLYVLDKIWIINIVSKYWDLTDTIKKQQKIFLWNPCLYHINTSDEIWTIREVYFISQVKRLWLEIFWVKEWDYIVKYKNKEYRFEIWWKNKDFKQIKWFKNSFLAIDDIYSDTGKIPLWLFWIINTV